jgi:hypothetical protein
MLRRRRWLLAAGVVAVLPLPLHAADLAAEVAARLVDAPVLQGDFAQTRSLKGFKNPLVSRGDFLLLRARGVVWRTQAPFASTLVLTRDRLLTRAADGAVTSQLDARTEPALRAVNEVMFALLVGDMAALARHFRIDGELLAGSAWRLVLTPVDAMLASQFTQIGVEGDRHVRQVSLDERGGDRTVIRFSGLRATPAPTRDDEVRFESAGS